MNWLWIGLCGGLMLGGIFGTLLIQDYRKPYVCAHLAGIMIGTRQEWNELPAGVRKFATWKRVFGTKTIAGSKPPRPRRNNGQRKYCKSIAQDSPYE